MDKHSRFARPCTSDSNTTTWLKMTAGRKKEIFGWKFYKVRKFDSPKSLEDFGLERPPQSWCYTEVCV